MKILIVLGNSIYENISTNLFKERLIQELSKNNDVTVIMANQAKSTSRYVVGNIEYYEYSKTSFFSRVFKGIRQRSAATDGHEQLRTKSIKCSRKIKKLLISTAKKLFLKLQRKNSILYKHYSVWIKRASEFSRVNDFDLVLSLSYPPASHKLASEFIENNTKVGLKWFQVWFEPWAEIKSDKHANLIRKEEKKLIEAADSIFYANPLFLSAQINKYPEYTSKMKPLDLPVIIHANTSDANCRTNKSVGYFGSFFTKNRNITPFYEAMCKMEQVKSYIIGNSDIELISTENVIVKDRMEYNEVQNFQEDVSVLVVISNHNELVPGKIYEYSSTNKYVLFILDGTNDLKNRMFDYFSKYNRFIFCDNNEKDITITINKIFNGEYDDEIENKPIVEFRVENVINKILREY